MKYFFFLLIFLSFFGCSTENSQTKGLRKHNLKGEFIYRHQNEYFFRISDPQLVERETYPWEEKDDKGFPVITKDFFRCKGSSLNPVKIAQQNGESVRYFDCGGVSTHSLPLKEGKEFIYPILPDILNHLQKKTGKKVVITCGHCCPTHNLYVDSSAKNQTNKHLIGAEVDFYIQGMENQAEQVVNIILEFYKEQPQYQGLKDFLEFKRYDKPDTNVATHPWYNKEIFIKVFKKTEGRDFDNRHSYPYISIQVRYDYHSKEKVQYSWDQAFRNYHRS